LLDSLNGVLAMAASNRVEDRLLRSLAYQEMRYELINDVSVIAPLADQVRRVGTELGLIDETDGVRLARAVTEALRNAMYHGNLELPLGEFEDGDQLPPGDADVIAMLHSEGPYDGRRIHFRAAFNREEARITIRDEGPGFNPAAVADAAADPAQLSGGGGHGLLLIRMFVDEVTFNEVGNEITLIKRRRCSPPAAQ
jgi:anti-sigma regulatory factor (Ser/Thr protein kinase)